MVLDVRIYVAHVSPTPRLAAPVDSCSTGFRDERKPRCQRCIDGGFECQYGSRLTFLDKNALTVSSTSDAGDASTPPRYFKLQFVNPTCPNQTAEPSSPPSPVSQDPPNPSITTNSTDIPVCISPSQTPAPPVSTFQNDPQLLDAPVLQLQPLEPHLAPPFHHPSPRTQWRSQSIGHESLASPAGNFHITDKPPDGSANSDAAYETALNALLSLGNEGADLESLPSRGSGSYAAAGDGFRVSPQELISASPNSAEERRAPAATLPLTAPSVSPDRLLQLLRHFTYQLDLCDMSQTFGLHVPRLAIENEGVFHFTFGRGSRRATGGQGGVSMGDGGLVHLALWTACQFTSSVPDAWQDLHGMMDDNFWSVALAEVTPKAIAILSVLIRLELAAALVTGAPISVPERLHYDAMSQPSSTSAQAAAAPARTPPSARASPPTPVHRWTMLSDALGAWYANRAQEFRPMAEMDGEESLFPVVLFTNGAAVFANPLYHTAMPLLLQNKPRVLLLQTAAAAAAAKKSSAAPLSSPLWHAQSVCGIALNNDRRDSWDLCLVASLYLAAQRMTYEPQQRAILRCFERVRALTGWRVDGFSAKAREDWGLM
ncbi:uncharacterized protein GLRG_10980 [Colletotrichum graminicola M1.001]|uniref:Zn(2)-C6 fungal-type domain-containing protein n=1 Tax=Colletotrichum graminicola (strain M1.001 / M2 / FGSC 10212) TaxID=645133 RepID=E3QY47_COLGM|nr:uncharacterized protein GLRG_10980 [Colletotrichum graminicola M1.001]EFQ35785.1 hypothetical protein GLRG_10980 [Colletotrichum graminicola M1.001]